MNQTELLIDSEKFNDQSVKGKCVIPIAPHPSDVALQKNSWMLGAIFMQKYYMVFDATPSTEYSLDYLRIGIGLEDHLKEDEMGSSYTGDEETNWIDEYIIYVYIVIILLIVFVLSCIIFTIKKKIDRERIENTSIRTLSKNA